jgi:hypothetical protein
MTILASTIRGYLQAISGMFISPQNPHGLTPRELDIIMAIIFVLREEKKAIIDVSVKHKVAALTNHPLQVITNYIKKLRDKRVLDSDNKLHPILLTDEITIQKEDNL